MGVSAGGIVLNYEKELDLIKLFSKLNRTVSIIPNSEVFKRFDRWSDRFFQIAFYRNDIWIFNSNLSQFFFKNDKNIIQTLYDFFERPKIIVAFQEYDSAGANAFAIIENGGKIRHRMYSIDNPLDEFGDPLEIEDKWLEGEVTYEKVDEDSFLYYKYYTIEENGVKKISSEEGLTRTILHEILESHFSIVPWDKRPELPGFHKEIYVETSPK